jgi:outer membrane protein TolC
MKKKPILLYIVYYLLFFPVGLYAQTTIRNVDELWKYADAHNISIVSARYEAEKAKMAKRISYGALLPQISASGMFTDNTALQTTLLPGAVLGKPNLGFIPVPFGQEYVYNGTFSGQMDLMNLQNLYNAKVAKATQLFNENSLANTRKNIYQQLASNYYNYLLMKEAVRLNEANLKSTDSVLLSVQNKFKEGSENEMNLNKAKINLEKIRENLISAQYQMLSAKNNILALLNLSLRDEYNLTDSLEFTQDEISAAFQEDPGTKMAFSQQEVSLRQYQASKLAFMPTLSLQYNYSTMQSNNSFKPFAGGVPWYPSSFWSLKANIPLFTGGTRYWQVKKNKLDLEEYTEKYNAALKQADINDANLKLAFGKAQAMVKRSDVVMHLSYENYIHASNRYASGISSIEEKLKAFSDYIDNQNQYLNNLSDYLIQLYQVKIRQQNF